MEGVEGGGAESGAGDGGGVDIKSLLRDSVLSVRRRLGRDLGSFGVSRILSCSGCS